MGNYKKLEVIDGKTSNWQGLWWHPEYNGFSSAVIDLSQLRKFKGKVRLYIRKNKFYKGGENGRPNYNFCIKDADSDIFKILEIEDEIRESDDDGDAIYLTQEEACETARYQYDGRSDPCDIYCPWDFPGHTLKELLEMKDE